MLLHILTWAETIRKLRQQVPVLTARVLTVKIFMFKNMHPKLATCSNCSEVGSRLDIRRQGEY